MVEGFEVVSPIKSLSLLLLAWISPEAVAGMTAKVEVWPGRLRCKRRLISMPRAEGVPRIAPAGEPTMSRWAATEMPTRSRMAVLLSMLEAQS